MQPLPAPLQHAHRRIVGRDRQRHEQRQRDPSSEDIGRRHLVPDDRRVALAPQINDRVSGGVGEARHADITPLAHQILHEPVASKGQPQGRHRQRRHEQPRRPVAAIADDVPVAVQIGRKPPAPEHPRARKREDQPQQGA